MADRTRKGRPAVDPAASDRRRQRKRAGNAPEQPSRRRRGSAGGAPSAPGTADVAPGDIPDAAVFAAPTPSGAPAEKRSTTVATEVVVPQLGESVTEGTITAWLVQEGDQVEADQPIFELSSDKIDTEVPAPASGVLKEIKVGVDETVDVGTVVAIIGDADEEAPADADEKAPADADEEAPADADDGAPAGKASDEPQEEAVEAPSEGDEKPADEPDEKPARSEAPQGNGEAAEGRLMSPLVRRLLSEHDLDPGQIEATGEGGRITREDVERVIGGEAQPKEAPKPSGKAPVSQARKAPLAARERERMEDLSRIRQRIAAKMMESIQSSAQLTTVQEADMTAVMRLRERLKDEFKAREGVSLSPFVFLARAAVLALRRHPTVNAQADWEAGKVRFHEYVNLGIAVDTDKGLLVPNVKNADDLTLAALARAIQDVANRARGIGKLEMQDIEGGTFTVTNTGSRGVLIDTPILNYPEVAILGTGAIKKHPVVLEDESTGPSIAIRDMIYLCLTYDHRLIDGADAARYVTDVAEVVQTHDWEGELGY